MRQHYRCSNRRKWVRYSRFFIFVSICFCFVSESFAQPIAETDYEWELLTPGRTVFRDRVPVGQIALVKTEGGGIFGGGKGKPTGELLTLIADVAFIPGDTARFFGVGIELSQNERVFAAILLDLDELPSFYESVNYIAKTAQNIAETQRIDTQIRYRGKSGWSLEFTQRGTEQFLGLVWDDHNSGMREHRSLTPEQLKILSDLLELSTFEINRQGGNVQLKKKN